MNHNGDKFPAEVKIPAEVKHFSKPGKPLSFGFGAADDRAVIRVLTVPVGLHRHYKTTMQKAPCPLRHCPKCGAKYIMVRPIRGTPRMACSCCGEEWFGGPHPDNGCELQDVYNVSET